MIPGRRSPARAAGVALAVAGLVTSGGTARAEYGGQQVFVDRPKLGLELTYRYDAEDRKGPFIDSSETSQIISEQFDVETEGWLYHPAVAQYALRLSPEWQQTSDVDDPGTDQSSSSTLLGYGLDLTLLPFKPYTVNLFTRQDNSVFTNSLAARSEAETAAYGASVNLKYPQLPTILSYAHSNLDQTGFYPYEEIRDELRLDSQHAREASDTRLNGSYVATDRTGLGAENNTTVLFGGLVNTYRGGPADRLWLSSLLSYRDTTSGPSEYSGATLSESASWQHRKNLSSNYNFQLLRDDVDGLSINRTLGSAGLSHTLYENLITTAGVNASSDSQGEDIYGGNLGFAYQRSIPWGTIYAGLGQGYTVTHRSQELGLVQVLDEAHVLTTGDVTLLDNRNVDEASIRVTDADNAIVYFEGIDYTIELVGDFVRISRSPLGAIADGQAVLVDYTYLSDPAYDDSVHDQSYNLGLYLWSAWRINYRHFHSQQEFLGGTPPDVLNDNTVHLFDTELTWRWSTTRALYEDTDQTSGISQRRWRVEEQLRFRPTDRWFLGLSAYTGETLLKDTGGEEQFQGARVDLQRMLTRSSRLRIEGVYDEVEGTSVRTIDKGALLTWDWTYGIWRAELTYRYLNQEDLNQEQTRDSNSVFFSFRRTLF